MNPDKKLRKKRSKPRQAQQTRTAQSPVKVEVITAEQNVVPYDENLLERARIQWQFGDWQSLAGIERSSLQHHPDRAKLALLAAAGQLQLGHTMEGRQLIRLAQDWGIDARLCAQILVGGVYNSLARVFSIAGQKERALQHFEQSVYLGNPGSTLQLLAQARSQQQLQQIRERQLAVIEHANPASTATQANKQVQQSEKTASAPVTEYLFGLKIHLDNNQSKTIGFNTTQNENIKVNENRLTYQAVDNKAIYLVSNEHGSFEHSPREQQIHLLPGKRYVLSGELETLGSNPPIIWFFQYADNKRIDSQSVVINNGKFTLDIQLKMATEAVAIGIRLGGEGQIDLSGSACKLVESANADLMELFENKVEKIKEAHRKEVENSTKQIEATMRLQHYLGADVILPAMHNWPISPDFGVLLINLVEQNNYDAVIEFGSGTSTVILSRALKRVAHRDKTAQAPLLSFDHLEQYANQTRKLLQQGDLQADVEVCLAPLTPWQATDGQSYPYYSCQDALSALRNALKTEHPRILVVVDGPPAATGPNARYPALPVVMAAMPEHTRFDFLMDDYLRQEEQTIVKTWLQELTMQQRTATKTEFNQLEKKACLIEVQGTDSQ